ncbi:MAG TPA: DUF742 domain-containing protein [Pseudonocardiaceae bacterium]|nr:DUF742 domain-containing protein [Pseudonocardiaceae bacterium]
MTTRPDVPRGPSPGPADPEPASGEFRNGVPLDGVRRRAPRPAFTHWESDDGDDDNAPAVVRPYAWTRGRTTTEFRFEIETLLSTTAVYQEQDDSISSENHAVAALCHVPRSVAEVAALLRIPLGVARVLAGDMAMAGLLAVHETASVDGDSPDLALMERILSGLRRL